MKPFYLLIFSGFLFFGCSQHLEDSVVNKHPQINSPAKPADTIASHTAREFTIKPDAVPEKSFTILPAEATTRDGVKATGNLQGRKIILEQPEGESQKRLLIPAGTQKFVLQTLKSERKFSLTFENDIFDLTDRYYTNGVRFDLTSPGLSHSPISRLMITYNHPASTIYSVYLAQNMYTPISTKIPPELSGNDRPYAAYMILGHRKETTDATRKLKITNDITLGVIGSNSLGSLMQQGVHHTLPTNDPPLGWETQINNDIVADFRVQVEKTISGSENFQIGAIAAAEAGTLYDNLMAGFRVHASRNSLSAFTSSFENPKEARRKPELQGYFQGEGRIIGYDATLQGGIFNHDNIYTLQVDQVEHIVLKAEAGVSLRYLQYGLELGQSLLSPEYNGGKMHKWGRITLNFYFR
jgi:lipid A 3-O-deacylase